MGKEAETERNKLNEINAVMSTKNYDDIWQQLIDDIMNSDVPWQKTWDSKIGNAIAGMPISGGSGREYTGFNRLYLTLKINQLRGDKESIDPRFYTFNQIAKLGKEYHIIKGAHGCAIQMHFFINKDKYGNLLPLEEQRWHKKFLTVFHPSQIGQHVPVLDSEGNKIPLLDEDGNQRIGRNGQLLYQMEDRPFPEYVPRFRPYTHEEQNELIDIMLKKSGAVISHDQTEKNFYTPTTDELHLTPRGAYKDINDYYRTTLHELCHWTGHKSRLNRDLSNKLGSKEYAREELRAEIAAAFICSNFNIPLSKNHGAYLQSWLNKLNRDPKEMESAQRDAHKITNYINNLVRERIKELEVVREQPDCEYTDYEKEKTAGEKAKESREKSTANEIVIELYQPVKEVSWAGKAFIDTIKNKIPVDYSKYNLKCQCQYMLNIPDSIDDMIKYLKNAKNSRSDNYVELVDLEPGNVLRIADRLFYINKPGDFSHIRESGFYQEVAIRNFKDMQIMVPLEGEIREKIKAEQIAQIGKGAFDNYRKQFREVFFGGERLSSEDCKDNMEFQYKKYIYDHTFKYGVSGIRPCDQKSWQKADTDFCIKIFENSLGDTSAMFTAVNVVEQNSPYTAANPELDYTEILTANIMKNPEYQKMKQSVNVKSTVINRM